VQTLRNTKIVARLVLVWFALFISVSIASPIVQPTDLHMVCTGSGAMKLVSSGDEGGADVKLSVGMDCPLCAATSASFPARQAGIFKPIPLAHALHPIAVAHIASATAPPLPSRGPPSLSLS